MIKAFFQNLFSKKQESKGLSHFSNMWNFSYLWSSLDDCDGVQISRELLYEIQKQNTTIQSFVTNISNKVWKNWMYLIDKKGDIVIDEKYMNMISDYFSTPTFASFKKDYFTHYFWWWEIFIAQKTTLADSSPTIVDNRTMQGKLVDDFGTVAWYIQRTKKGEKEYNTETMYNHIVNRDIDNPNRWASKYEPIVWDAMSSIEISKRNFHFFRNNARPDVIIWLKDLPWASQEEIQAFKDKFEAKFRWTSNSHKTHITNAIDTVKVLEMNHKDLQLLELDVMSTKKIGMLFQIDPRLLWFSDDVGAYATMNEIWKHSQEALSVYQRDLEDDMNNIRQKRQDPKTKYRIKLDGETWTNREVIEEAQRKDIELGILTIEEIRAERDLPTDNLPINARKHFIKNSLSLIDNVWIEKNAGQNSTPPTP